MLPFATILSNVRSASEEMTEIDKRRWFRTICRTKEVESHKRDVSAIKLTLIGKAFGFAANKVWSEVACARVWCRSIYDLDHKSITSDDLLLRMKLATV